MHQWCDSRKDWDRKTTNSNNGGNQESGGGRGQAWGGAEKLGWKNRQNRENNWRKKRSCRITSKMFLAKTLALVSWLSLCHLLESLLNSFTMLRLTMAMLLKLKLSTPNCPVSPLKRPVCKNKSAQPKSNWRIFTCSWPIAKYSWVSFSYVPQVHSLHLIHSWYSALNC